jgi:uncharacterized protein YxeA
MIKSWYKGLPKKIRQIILILVLLLIGSIIGYAAWSLTNSNIPDSFTNSRQTAWGYAQIISSSVKDTPKNLETIQSFERDGKDTQALTLLVSEAQKNSVAQDAALKLAAELEIMAKEIPNIKPERAGQSALVAISTETALIYKLVSYNNYLANLLELLRDKITGRLYGVDKINQVVDSINGEINAINLLNTQFIEKMAEFDKNS